MRSFASGRPPPRPALRAAPVPGSSSTATPAAIAVGSRAWLVLAVGLAVAAPLSAARAGVTEFQLAPASGPFGIAAGPDGAVWFTESQGGRIGRLTPAGALQEFPLPAGVQPAGIALGPDGNLWLAESGPAAIGRLTPAGVLTEFPIPVPNLQPGGITAGPDGNLWFTLQGAAPHRIGRITPAGAFALFPTPSQSGPSIITLGPDGNLWYTGIDLDVIGRVTPSGFITELPTIGPASGITAGPDGNVWFTFGNRIVRMRPDGTTLDIFSTGAGTFVGAIVRGPDQALWFRTTPPRLGRVTPGGHLTQLPLANQPFFLATGPDGNLWFTADQDRVGRLSLNVLATGAGPGGGPHVRLFDAQGGTELSSFFAYDPGFAGGVRVAVGDVTGDGVPDVVTGPGAGGGPHVRVFDGFTGAPVGGPLGSFFAFAPGFTGGVAVATADVNCDGRADVVVGAGPGGGPHVEVFDGATGGLLATPLASFFAYDPGFTGGVSVGVRGCAP